MRHAFVCALLLALMLVPPPPLPAATTLRVKRLALATVYLDGGRDAGLVVGDRLEVTANGTVVARMEIVSVNANAAACRVLSLTRPIRMGDLATPARPGSAARPARGDAGPPAASPSEARPATTVGAHSPASSPRRAESNDPTTEGTSDPPASKAAAPPSAARPVVAPASDSRLATKPAARPDPITPPGFDPTPGASVTRKAEAASATRKPTAGSVVDGDPPGFGVAPSAPGPKAPSVSGSAPHTLASTTPVSTTPAPPSPASASTASTTASKSPASPSGGTPVPTPTTPPAAVDPPPAASVSNGTALAAPRASPLPSPSPPTAAGFASLSSTPLSSSTPSTSPAVGAANPVPALSGDESFRVKYRSANNVYLEGGRAQGLMVGDQLLVHSGAKTVAELQVVYVAELSASCKVLSETRPVQAGDQAVAVARPGVILAASTQRGSGTTSTTASASPAAASAPAPANLSPGGAWARVRGGASFGFYKTWDETDSGLDFEQRTGRLDLGLYDIAGQPLTFTVRARSRQDIRARTLSFRTPADERIDRLYELALRYEPPSDLVSFEVGRIGIYRFVGIGYLDGAIGRVQVRPGLQLGAFGGRDAEIEGLGLEGTGGKYGAFIRLAPAGRYRIGGYDVLLAYVRENAEGDVSREYVTLESSLSGGGRWSLFQRAELDLNRGWRREVTGKGQQFSNISLSGNLRVADTAWAFVSYDGRRSYRYFRNRTVPEEVFDDLLRQGLRAGLNLARPGGFGASASFGLRLKESDPLHPELDVANAYSFNAGVRHSNLFSSGLSAGVDGSGFTNGYTEGGLLSAHLGLRFEAGHTLDLSYGYSLYSIIETQEDRTTQWLRFMGRAELGRRFYVLGDFEYDAGDDLQGPRGLLELGVLF